MPEDILIYMNIHGFNQIYLNLPIFFLNLLEFTRIYLNIPEFT